MKEVVIRRMKMEDIEDVLEIEKRSFSVPWTRKAFEKELSSNQLAVYFVAVIEDKVIGYGGMWLIIDEGHITNVAVHPEYRGYKIGKRIMEVLISDAQKRNLQKMTLEVRRSNVMAQNLYKGLGFIPCGIRPEYYYDNQEDAIIMWKELI